MTLVICVLLLAAYLAVGVCVAFWAALITGAWLFGARWPGWVWVVAVVLWPLLLL